MNHFIDYLNNYKSQKVPAQPIQMKIPKSKEIQVGPLVGQSAHT
jgi:hypothetical protein